MNQSAHRDHDNVHRQVVAPRQLQVRPCAPPPPGMAPLPLRTMQGPTNTRPALSGAPGSPAASLPWRPPAPCPPRSRALSPAVGLRERLACTSAGVHKAGAQHTDVPVLERVAQQQGAHDNVVHRGRLAWPAKVARNVANARHRLCIRSTRGTSRDRNHDRVSSAPVMGASAHKHTHSHFTHNPARHFPLLPTCRPRPRTRVRLQPPAAGRTEGDRPGSMWPRRWMLMGGWLWSGKWKWRHGRCRRRCWMPRALTL
jgi:hypothetical protein